MKIRLWSKIGLLSAFSMTEGGGSSLEITVFLRILMTHPVFFAAYRKFFKE